MPKLRGSKIEHNMLAAFAGECQARNRYSLAANIARKEGYEGSHTYPGMHLPHHPALSPKWGRGLG